MDRPPFGFRSRAYMASRTEERTNGRRIESSRTILSVSDTGITANMTAAIGAALRPNPLSAILYTKKVSRTASRPMRMRGAP